MQVTSREFDVKSRSQIGDYVSIGTVDLGIVSIDDHRPVIGIGFELDFSPVLEVDTGIQDEPIKRLGFLANLVAPDIVRFVSGGPLAARIVHRGESWSPHRTSSRIDSVAAAWAEALRHVCIDHPVRIEGGGQIEFGGGAVGRLRDETGT